MQDPVGEHGALLQAIAAGDAATARGVALEHVLAFERQMRAVL